MKKEKSLIIRVKKYSCFRTWEWQIVSKQSRTVVCISKTKFADKSQAMKSIRSFFKSMGIKLEIEIESEEKDGK